LEPRLASLALQRLQQRGLFTTFVGASTGVHRDVAVEAAAQDVRPDVPGGPRLLEGVGHAPDGVDRLAADVNERAAGPDRPAGDDDAFDERMWIVHHERHVPACAGLSLITVDHHVALPERLAL